MQRRTPAGTLTTGRVGAATGVSADTIRHYEKLGLLGKPSRTASGYRVFASDTANRVATIRRALKAGFSLHELAGIFQERDSGGAPCRRVAALARCKLADMENRICELSELRDWLSATLDHWEGRLRQTPPGQRARLLESLPGVRGASFERKQS